MKHQRAETTSIEHGGDFCLPDSGIAIFCRVRAMHMKVDHSQFALDGGRLTHARTRSVF
jgi:hypothetical protein